MKHCLADADGMDEEGVDNNLSPTSRDIQEQIRKLNEKFSVAEKALQQAPKDIRPAIDYKYKYKIVKRWVSICPEVRHKAWVVKY